ncbi:MAG: hypothetical protein QOG64_241 [Acidimicrobiaceae bacterium]|nr:hypothetical protein [Acidimicrobiaceae bacterium]
MKKVRRIGGVAVACLLLTSFVAGPASADQPESYNGSATGTALQLTVLGQSFTFGTSAAKAASDLTASADGAGQATPILPTSVTHSEVTGDNTAASKPQACLTPDLGASVTAIISLGLACSQTSASVAGGNPAASGSGSVASLGLSANSILAQTPIGSTLQQVLAPITAADPTKTLGSLIDSVFNSKTLDVTLGSSTSSVTSAAGAVTSLGIASGVVIKILPTPLINGAPSTDPFATITVGQAKAIAVYDRAAGTSKPTVDPALVRVDLNPLIAQGLGVPASTTLTLDQDLVVPGTAGTPLESEIKVGHGSTTTNPDGSVGAIADGVSIALLRGVSGGIILNLAHAEATVKGAPAVVTAPVVVPQLPRTGGSPWIPLVGVTLLGLAFVTHRTARRVHR